MTWLQDGPGSRGSPPRRAAWLVHCMVGGEQAEQLLADSGQTAECLAQRRAALGREQPIPGRGGLLLRHGIRQLPAGGQRVRGALDPSLQANWTPLMTSATPEQRRTSAGCMSIAPGAALAVWSFPGAPGRRG